MHRSKGLTEAVQVHVFVSFLEDGLAEELGEQAQARLDLPRPSSMSERLSSTFSSHLFHAASMVSKMNKLKSKREIIKTVWTNDTGSGRATNDAKLWVVRIMVVAFLAFGMKSEEVLRVRVGCDCVFRSELLRFTGKNYRLL